MYSRYYNADYDLTVSTAYQWLDEEQDLVSTRYFLERVVDNKSIYINVEKGLDINWFNIFLSYQFNNSRLAYLEDRSDLISPHTGRTTAPRRVG